jgi:YHS domain-containing protein
MPNVVRDPVCEMEINLENAEERSEYEGEIFYFCSRLCRNKFDEDPGRFISRADLRSGGGSQQSVT